MSNEVNSENHPPNMLPEEKYGEQPPVVPNKRAKLDPKFTAFRAWSQDVDDKSCSTIYTLKCFYGDPTKTLPSRIKTSKVENIKLMLSRRGVSTQGSKAVLLDRLQKDLPYVKFDLDSRECLQRVIHVMLHSFGWDNAHLFACKMPRRGSLKLGAERLLEALGDLGFAIISGVNYVSANPKDHECRMRRHIQRTLDEAGLTWEDISKLRGDKKALGPWRKLQGAAFEPFGQAPLHYYEEDIAARRGGHVTLDELELRAKDTIQVTYDFGDSHRFTIHVEAVKEHADKVLPEANFADNKTRAVLVGKGNGKIVPQYGPGF